MQKTIAVFFEHVLKGELNNNIIEDLAFFFGQIAPSLMLMPKMNSEDKSGINQRVMVNYLIEHCVRTLLDDEFHINSKLTDKFSQNPESFELSDILEVNKAGTQAVFNILALLDFLIQKIVFMSDSTDFEISEFEVEQLQTSIKDLHNKMESSKDFLPSLLSNFLPTAKYSSTGIDFDDDHFKNKFRLTVLKQYQQRSKKKEVKNSLRKYLTESIDMGSFDDDPVFEARETEQLVKTFRKHTPDLFINEKTVTGNYKQTCYHCGEVYETIKPVAGSRRNKVKHNKENKPKLIRPLQEKCKEKDRCMREDSKKLYEQMESQYPKKQFDGPVTHFNPVPEGHELIRVNGDGNCMYSSIAEIYNRHQPSEEANAWNQQRVRDTIDDNLRSIYNFIQNHPHRDSLLNELGVLTGLETEVIPTIIEDRVITQSAAAGFSELEILQQFGDTQLIPLLVPTQRVRFSVITQSHSGLNTGVYDLNHWVALAPNLLAALLANQDFSFPDLSETERLEIAELLESDVNRASERIAIITSVSHSIGHLIHYPNAVR